MIPPKKLKEKIKEVSEERLKLCNACKYHSSNTNSTARAIPHCTLCKCAISAKTSCLSCRCALYEWEKYGVPQEEPKWGSVLLPEEEYDIDDKLNFEGDEE